MALTVYNASSVRGQAKAVTDELRAAGFESIRASSNDPLYPAADLQCVAQIRYGEAGAAAARTVLLIAPCAQLVLDSRVDDSVDLALGGRYLYGSVSDDVKAQLRSHPGGRDTAGRDRGANRGRQAVAADPTAAPGRLLDLNRLVGRGRHRIAVSGRSVRQWPVSGRSVGEAPKLSPGHRRADQTQAQYDFRTPGTRGPERDDTGGTTTGIQDRDSLRRGVCAA